MSLTLSQTECFPLAQLLGPPHVTAKQIEAMSREAVSQWPQPEAKLKLKIQAG